VPLLLKPDKRLSKSDELWHNRITEERTEKGRKGRLGHGLTHLLHIGVPECPSHRIGLLRAGTHARNTILNQPVKEGIIRSGDAAPQVALSWSVLVPTEQVPGDIEEFVVKTHAWLPE
jgi:hypothetical protein